MAAHPLAGDHGESPLVGFRGKILNPPEVDDFLVLKS